MYFDDSYLGLYPLTMNPFTNSFKSESGISNSSSLKSYFQKGSFIKIPSEDIPLPNTLSNNNYIQKENPLKPVGTGVVALARQQQSFTTVHPYPSIGMKRKFTGLLEDEPLQKIPRQDSSQKVFIPSLSELCLKYIVNFREYFKSSMNSNMIYTSTINQIFKYFVNQNSKECTSSDLMWFARAPGLKIFYCKNLVHIKESDFIRALQSSSNSSINSHLNQFIFKGCLQLTGEILDFLMEDKYDRIEKLDLSGCNSIQGKKIVKFLKSIHIDNLVHLSLKGCGSITKDQFTKISELGHYSSLESIDLSYCMINDFQFEEILKNSRVLNSISIENCPNLTVHSLSLINRYIKDLRKLKISGMNNVTDNAIKLLLPFRSSLRSLSIRNCIKFTSPSLDLLLKDSIHLKNLDVSLCSLSPNTIQSLSSDSRRKLTKLKLVNVNIGSNLKSFFIKCGSSLESLNLSGTLIDDEILLYIQLYCKLLKEIDISFCKNISSNGISNFIEKCENLQLIHIYGSFISLHSLPSRSNLIVKGSSITI